MPTPAKCPRCNSELASDPRYYRCNSEVGSTEPSELCMYKTTHADLVHTRASLVKASAEIHKQMNTVDELTAALTREREKWERLKKWLYSTPSLSWGSQLFKQMNRINAEAKEGQQ